MADDNKRQPVPAGGAPIPSAIDAANATPADKPAEQHAADEKVDDREQVEARVLIDYGDYAPNDVMRASAAELERLKLAGVVDDHADAVAHAKAA